MVLTILLFLGAPFRNLQARKQKPKKVTGRIEVGREGLGEGAYWSSLESSRGGLWNRSMFLRHVTITSVIWVS